MEAIGISYSREINFYVNLFRSAAFSSACRTTFRATFRTPVATATLGPSATTTGVRTTVFFLAFLDLSFVLFVPYFKFRHGGNIIKQSEFNATQQVFQVQHAFERKDTTHGIGGLSTFVQPIQCSLAVELNSRGNC